MNYQLNFYYSRTPPKHLHTIRCNLTHSQNFPYPEKTPPTKILLHRAEISYFQIEPPMKARELKVTYLWTLAYGIVGIKLRS